MKSDALATALTSLPSRFGKGTLSLSMIASAVATGNHAVPPPDETPIAVMASSKTPVVSFLLVVSA
jgi:hypothetical protein